MALYKSDQPSLISVVSSQETQANWNRQEETVAETRDETVVEIHNETVCEIRDETVLETQDETVAEIHNADQQRHCISEQRTQLMLDS